MSSDVPLGESRTSTEDEASFAQGQAADDRWSSQGDGAGFHPQVYAARHPEFAGSSDLSRSTSPPVKQKLFVGREIHSTNSFFCRPHVLRWTARS